MTLLVRQFLSFAGVGVVGTSAHFLALYSLVEFAGVVPYAASGAGFALGALVNYILNYYLTFQSDNRHREAMLKFFVVAFVGLVLNTLIMRFATEIIVLHYLLAQVIATGLVLIWNFAGNKYWTFRVDSYADRS